MKDKEQTKSKEPFSLFTKRIHNPENPDDYVTVIRFTKILHGDFHGTTEKGWKIWGRNRFGKRHGPIVTYVAEEDMAFIKEYKKGKECSTLRIIHKDNDIGLPYYETVMRKSSIASDERDTFYDIFTYCMTRIGVIPIQNILAKRINKTVNGRAVPGTIEYIYEPRIGGPTFPVVINIYKDIELDKLYTLWMRPTQKGGYKIIAAARSSATPDGNSEFGFKSQFDEIVILNEPFDIGDYPEKDPAAFASIFDVNYYEKLKEEDNREGLFISFESVKGRRINHAFMNVKDENEVEKEITKDITEAEVELLLFDLQRGSGCGIKEVRTSIFAYNCKTGEGEVSSPSPEDVQCSGAETSSIPDGNENGDGSPNGD